ncbi:hypothetical protein BKA58DRAFT_61420 [Alternaria rosae]|uniref:uncharacterized protein n=1 Tax=Alternaria rosae TaxID=1187941 RepID=UPI001E8EE067|nr:uncharacterized protein BKA58DRAFT_61420 [Alternaria rosae]KAH6852873.1 hypothetical protein BKA58DRAFT_61420 [Alternaria rosae]
MRTVQLFHASCFIFVVLGTIHEIRERVQDGLVDGWRCGLRVSQEAIGDLHCANNEAMQGRCEASSVAHCEKDCWLWGVRYRKGTAKMTGVCKTIWFSGANNNRRKRRQHVKHRA